ncbi:MAG: YwiC-like family protein [Bryobacteraceae bacterium]|nr:YwiC-like family protein [Bryobacteraceae bacterium]
MRWRTRLRLPKEHGAWGMLYAPLVLGALAAGEGAGRIALLALAATFVFVGREPALAWRRARVRGRDPDNAGRLALAYFALAAAVGAPLVVFERLYGMLALGGISAALLAWNSQQAVKREERTLATELIGIAGLTLTAPAAFCAGRGEWSSVALWLWLLSGLYFGSSVFYVKLRVLTAHAGQTPEWDRMRRLCFAYHIGLAALALGVTASERFGVWVPLAYAPVIARAFWELARPARTLSLRRIGILEIVYSIVFVALAAAGVAVT